MSDTQAAPAALQSPDDRLRERVLQAIADNRTPGLHFVGHFMGTAWDEVSPVQARIAIETAPHTSDANGEANLVMVTTLVDMALANAIRACLSMETGMRLGTISLHIAFTGVPLAGRLEAVARCEGWVEGALTRQGIAHCRLTAGGRVACIASGTFMELPPPVGVTLAPLPWQPGGVPPGDRITVRDLDARERGIWSRADEAIGRMNRANALADLDENKKTPSHGSKNTQEKKVGSWLQNQKNNYKRKINCMIDEKIYNLWTTFIEEYKEYIEWQRANKLKCPILHLEKVFDTQGAPMYEIRPSFVTELNVGGMNHNLPVVKNNANVKKTMDAALNNSPFNCNQYESYDKDNQNIGIIGVP
jgi:acyl-coenzyme A thioesterase PaaI-like protein